MCETCGCGDSAEFKIHEPNHTHDHSHTHDQLSGQGHTHSHGHDHGHPHTHSHEHSSVLFAQAPSADASPKKVISLNVDILSDNNRLARLNRKVFTDRSILSLNLVSSPGSGKTSILEKTIKALIATQKIFVIEGDQQTLLDADRIEKAGAPAIQINTGSGCHLDARMVETAYGKLGVEENSILFIENVGNLVCPALFDLGEFKRVVVISVTEGEDKPLKYPYMFQSSQMCLINKSDLLPYVDFNVDKTIEYARSLNPDMEFIIVSARTGEGMDLWYEWLLRQK
jgi:hydrogenase nickel incorporation protein HypB